MLSLTSRGAKVHAKIERLGRVSLLLAGLGLLIWLLTFYRPLRSSDREWRRNHSMFLKIGMRFNSLPSPESRNRAAFERLVEDFESQKVEVNLVPCENPTNLMIVNLGIDGSSSADDLALVYFADEARVEVVSGSIPSGKGLTR